MAHEPVGARWRRLYGMLVRLHPRPFRDRFARGMEQTFVDLCRERREAGGGLGVLLLRIFLETSAGVARERIAMTTARQRSLLRLAGVTAGLLLVPLVAMRFTDAVAWGPADFLVAGALLFGAGLAYELVAGRAGSAAYRIASGLAVATGLVLFWANLAVGILGSEGDPANMLYLGVFAVGLGGALLARFRPRGMARALLATAAAQALVPLVALAVWWPAPASTAEVVELVRELALSGFFAVLFAASGLLFRRADAAVAEPVRERR